MVFLANGSKTHIITKLEHAQTARKVFQGTGVNISAEGRRYQGEAMGSTSFPQQFIRKRIQKWVEEIKLLSEFAITQPHAAYTAFMHGLSSRWNYLLCVTDWEEQFTSQLLQPLESAIQSQFILALTGHAPQGHLVQDLLALPACPGGLGLINRVAVSAEQHATSKLISAPTC